MSVSFSISSKSESSRVKRRGVVLASDDAEEDKSNKKYVTEFLPAEAPPAEPKIVPIAPIPDQRFNHRLQNLQNLPLISQSGVADGTLVFELHSGCNPDVPDGSMSYGLNVRAPSIDDSRARRGETVAELELRKFREDMKNLPDDLGMDQYDDVPVEGFGAAVMAGYGWKEGMGIGRNAKEDVTVVEVGKKRGRGGLGFEGAIMESRVISDGFGGQKVDNGNDMLNGKEGNRFDVGKEVRIVKGSNMGMKGKILEVRKGGDLLIIRTSRRNEKVKVQSMDVAEIGSAEEEQCLRKLKELKIKEKDVTLDKKDRNSSRPKDEKSRLERVNWLRNHIRVRIISKDWKKGRLFLKKGVVVDVVGPGVCDISMDESRELVQGVDQELLETALPKRGGHVLVLYGKNKGVYGSLVEKDLDKETGLVQDADTHELLNVRLEQIAEYTGDPNEIGY